MERNGARTIAVLGLGEAGSLIARDLVRAGHAVRGWDPDLHGDLSEIPIASSFADAVAPADVVLSVNWAIVAADVAREALPHLRAGRIYADLNTAGPALKKELAAIVAPSSAAFVDVAMMSPVPGFGIRVPMFLAGDGAQAFSDLVRPLGTPVEVVGAEPGEAAARKLTRSVFFKGMSAAIGEALEAARAAGVEDWLRSDITRTLVNADGATLDRIVEGTRKHAKRRAHEMQDAAALLRELGVPCPVTDATVASLQRVLGQHMALKRMDNIGIVVEDLGAMVDFFRELGLELEGQGMIEGEWAGRVTGLGDQRVEVAMMRMPDGHGRIELSRFLVPRTVADHRNAPVNALGYLRVMFAVDDLDGTLERLRKRGARLVGDVVQYFDMYRLCYIRGPENVLIGLAEELSASHQG